MVLQSTRLDTLLAACVSLGCAEVVVEEPEGGRQISAAGAAGEGSTSRPGALTPAGAGGGFALPAGGTGSREPTSAAGASGGGNAGRASAGNAGLPPPGPAPVPLPAGGDPGELLLLDDFEDGDDSGWIADSSDGEDLVGDWAVVETEEGRAYSQRDDSFDDDSWAIGGNITWSDVNLEARFRFTSASDIEDAVAMFAVRFRDRDNYYYVEYRGDGSVKIRKRVDGSEPELTSDDLERAAVIGEWIAIGFRARGSSLQVTVDGAPLGSEVVDPDLASGGIGLGVKENAAVEFDDVRVTVP